MWHLNHIFLYHDYSYIISFYYIIYIIIYLTILLYSKIALQWIYVALENEFKFMELLIDY